MINRLIKLVSADGLTRYEPLTGEQFRPPVISRVCMRKPKLRLLNPDSIDEQVSTLRRDYEFTSEEYDFERGALMFEYKEIL